MTTLTIRVQRTHPDQVGTGWGDESDESVAERATAAEVAAVRYAYPDAEVEVWDRVPDDARVVASDDSDTDEIAEELLEIRDRSWTTIGA